VSSMIDELLFPVHIRIVGISTISMSPRAWATLWSLHVGKANANRLLRKHPNGEQKHVEKITFENGYSSR
jgi:hypothetical protein